jgi:hypothetical protein
MTFPRIKVACNALPLGGLGLNATPRAQIVNGPTSVPTITAPAPPPADVESRFLGRLSFEDGYPTTETVQQLYDELDFSTSDASVSQKHASAQHV